MNDILTVITINGNVEITVYSDGRLIENSPHKEYVYNWYVSKKDTICVSRQRDGTVQEFNEESIQPDIVKAIKIALAERILLE